MRRDRWTTPASSTASPARDDGTISWAQFIDLNRRVGGLDLDAEPSLQRTAADLAHSGCLSDRPLLDTGGGLANMPVIDYRDYWTTSPAATSTCVSLVLHPGTAVEANGTPANHVMLEEDDRYGLFGMTSPVLRGALTQLDEWLTRLSTQTGPRTARSVAAAKPRSLTDACWSRDATARRIEQTLSFDNRGECGRPHPAFPTPRMVAVLLWPMTWSRARSSPSGPPTTRGAPQQPSFASCAGVPRRRL